MKKCKNKILIWFFDGQRVIKLIVVCNMFLYQLKDFENNVSFFLF